MIQNLKNFMYVTMPDSNSSSSSGPSTLTKISLRKGEIDDEQLFLSTDGPIDLNGHLFVNKTEKLMEDTTWEFPREK